MLSFWKSRPKYIALTSEDVEHHANQENEKANLVSEVSIRMRNCTVVTLALLLTLAIVPSWLVLFRVTSISSAQIVTQETFSNHNSRVCHSPVVRQEWRHLSEDQKRDYISAVRCLATKPSILTENSSRYDDFPWVHERLAAKTHVAAPFLPWHRAYIQVYETALKVECGMQGNLPYWDWSVDWEAPASAPVWDKDLGLGGDGEIDGPKTVGDGRCVVDGPFARLEVKYFDDKRQPHCLSRGFASDLELRELGSLIQPSAIERLMQEPVYARFEEDLERRAHHFLSHSVKGDLSRFTGPNDPVFFLHHVNIDRIWWQWQQTNLKERLYAYDGRCSNATDTPASLSNIMDMAGLAANLPVIDTMDTMSGRFCYVY